MVAGMHTAVTSYHCGCGSGGGASAGMSEGGAVSHHTAPPHSKLPTLANHTHVPGLVGGMPGGGGGVTQG